MLGVLLAFLARGSNRVSNACMLYQKQEGGRMNQKEGLDYFPMQCVTDKSIELVTAEFGIQAYAIIVKLLQIIYGGHGYYCEWDDEVLLLFAKENALAGCKCVSLINEIVFCCMRRGVFSRPQYEENGILTSREIQETFLHAAKRRKVVEMKKTYLLLKVAHLPENVKILDENVNILSENVYILKQRKEEENITTISKAQIPTLDEVKGYAAKNGMQMNLEKFYAYYQKSGWIDKNGNPVTDWKAALDYWRLNERKAGSQTQPMRPGKPKSQFHQFQERDISKKEMEDMERTALARGYRRIEK